MYRRKIIPLAIGLLLASLVVVNAAVFAYRWMKVDITVYPPTKASGAACTGFYSSEEQSDITQFLPEAGTNYNAETYGGYTISVSKGNVVCRWGSGATYELYESIEVSMNLTSGSWYIKDLYGFGYKGSVSDPTVYVWIKVEQPVSGVNYAYLQVYNASTGGSVVNVSLTTGGTSYGPYPMLPGKAFQLDLNISIANPGDYSFKVGFYVSKQNEEGPR